MKHIIVLFLLFSTLSFSQEENNTVRLTNDYTALKSNLSGAWISNSTITNVEGSIYLYDSWNTIGVISTNQNKNLSLVGLNYDTKSNVFVAKISEDSLYVFNDLNIKEVVLNRKRYKRYLKTGEKSYFEVLAVGNNIEILKKCNKTLKKGILDPLTQKTSADRYINKTTYFCLKEDKLEEFKLSKKSFSKLFGDKSKTIKAYMSDNKLSLKEDKNFQIILNHYSTL